MTSLSEGAILRPANKGPTLANKCPACHSDNPDTLKFCGECGTKLDVSATGHPPSPQDSFSFTKTMETTTDELPRGTLFAGRYEVIEELGQGGMGRVYRVHDAKLNEEVALKLIRPEFGTDKRTVERFHNEIKIARKIGHRNVCRTFDLHEEGRTLYLTMEYVRGEDLKSFIKRSKVLSTGTAVSIAHQVAEGLAEAHKLGIVHRDLKPGNIMIDREGQAKIMDFGIARAMSERGITVAGAIIGTPEYMSPEQVEGIEADQRADIYALGVILFEMVTGQVPFEGETPFSVANKHRSEPPPIPKKLAPQIPEELNRLILRCLEKDKSRRYQTAEETLEDLAIVEGALPTAERTLASRTLTRRRPKRLRKVTVQFTPRKLLISATAVLVLVVAGYFLWRSVSPPEPIPGPAALGRPSLAILYFDNNSGDKDLDAWETGLADLFFAKLSQSKFINVIDTNSVYGFLKKLNLAEVKKYTREDLIKIAEQSGASHTISGKILKAGHSIVLMLTLQKPRTGEVVSSIVADCKGEEEIMTKADEVTNKIKSDLKMTPEQIAADLNKEAGKITTSSPEAFKSYTTARAYMVNLNFEAAIPLLERAVALDPRFANAYRSLGAAEGNLGHVEKSRTYLRKALELSDRVSERERYGIQGSYYASSERTWDKAIEAFTKLIELYPDDRFGNTRLGVLYSYLDEGDKAVERYEVITGGKVPSVITYDNLAEVYEWMGLPDKASVVLGEWTQNFPNSVPLRRAFSRHYIYQGKYEHALGEANKALALAPTNNSTILLIGQIRLLKGDLREAEEKFWEIISAPTKDQIINGKDHLAKLYLLEGRFRESMAQIRQVIELDREAKEATLESGHLKALGDLLMKTGDCATALEEYETALARAVEADDLGLQREALWKKGLAYIRLKSIENAQKMADELREMIEKGIYKKVIRLYHHLQGSIELEKGNYPLAIEYLRKATSSLGAQGYANYYDTLAIAFFMAGDLENAKRSYEKIVSLAWARLYDGDTLVKSYYMLGKIAEKQGDKARARENYKKFLDLWKDADPGLTEVEDTRKRLAVL